MILIHHPHTPSSNHPNLIDKLTWFNCDGARAEFRDPVRRYALALGCETKYMDEIVYGDDLNPASADSFEPIGISCRICERKKCHQRSIPPLRSEIKIEPFVRDLVPYDL